MKKIGVFLLAFVLALPLCGCGIREKIGQEVGEKIAEDILEDAGGGDVDIDDDKVVIKGSDGSTIVAGGGEWPSSDLAKMIPEFDGGKVASVIDSSDSVFISLEEVDEKDFETYLETIKSDFDQEPYSVDSDGCRTYGASNSEGVAVMVQFADSTLTITLAKAAE